MADNKYKDFSDEAIRELKRLEQEQKRIESDKQKYEKQGHDKRLAQYKDYKKRLQEIEELTKEITKDENIRIRTNAELVKTTRSILKLSTTVRRELGVQTRKASLFKSISSQIAEQKAIQAEGDEAQAKIAQQKEQIMSSILDDMTSQAKQVERALKGENEREQFAQRRRDIESMTGILTKEQQEELLAAVNRTEELYNKEQRILAIKEQQKGLYDSIPESLKSAVSFGKGLIQTLKRAGAVAGIFVLLGTVLTSAVMMFTTLDESAQNFRKNTGITVSQMKELNSQANRLVGEFRDIGLASEDFFAIQEQLVGVLGDTVRVSDEVAGVQAIITKNFGATNEAAAKSFQLFQSLGGLSQETAANLQLQTAELAKQVGVAPAKIFEDIANSSDTIYGLFRGNTEELVKQAVEARRLGTNLSQVLEVTEKLLDFESSISAELEASAFVGGQFNLTRARSLAAAGEEVEAQKEILRQIQRSGDFRQQDLFTQRALAAAAGMSVAEINRQLTVQERLNSLSDEQRRAAEQAIAQGLDISSINEGQLNQEVQRFKLQKEQQGQVQNLQNAFQGIAATLASSLVPLIETLTPLLSMALEPIKVMAEGLKLIVDTATEYKEITGLLAGTLLTVYGIQKGIVLYQRREAVLRLLNMKRGAAMAAISALSNPVMALAGIAAAATVIGLGARYLSTADDMVDMGGYGKRALYDEGSLTLLNNNDTVIAGTNLQGMSNNTTVRNDNSDLIREIRGLKKEFSKTRDTYIDGIKVTSRIGKVVDESTRNNFSLA